MDLQRDPLHPEVLTVRPTYEELLKLVARQEAVIKSQAETIQRLEEKIKQLEQIIRLQAEEIKLLKKKLYGSSSERRNKGNGGGKGGSGSRPKSPDKKPRQRSLTEQYPDAEVEELRIGFDTVPPCPCCHSGLSDAYLDEVSEQLHSIPARHKILRIIRRKFKCNKCFWGLKTAPLPPRIAPGSSLSDAFIIESIISKFYSLIPAERYAHMISQGGLKDFPPQLVLAAQHYGADFYRPIYVRIREYIQSRLILNADETTHKMLERTDVESWYLWGFSTPGAYYFEIHDTRSSEVAIDFLKKAACLFLMSDLYIGYERSVRIINEFRRSQGLPELIALFCNSHCRRRFSDAAVSYPEEAQFFIDQYAEIYKLDAEQKVLSDLKSRSKKRAEMKPFFEAMAKTAQQLRPGYSDNSTLVTAIDYFLNHYEGFTRFLDHPDLPLDNNVAERQLRSPVIGRKTWIGTHSDRGVETTEILFTLMQTCKLLKVNPRDYLRAVTQSMLRGEQAFTPSEYLDSIPDKKAVA
jgi:transposase